MRRIALVGLLILALLVAGCDYPVPFGRGISQEAAQRAQCCLSHKAKMWSGYVHSLPGT